MIPNLSIVIPVYNSEKILPNLTAEIFLALKDKIGFEIILVDDFSMDESWKIINDLAAENSAITGVRLRKNSGQDNSIMAGLSFAKGDYIAIMDDDLQHSPSDLLKLYEACKNGFDVCYGNFIKKNQSVIKNIGSSVNGKTAEVLISKPKQIYLSPFKVFTKAMAEEILKYTGPYPYVDGIILTITSNITQIDLEHQKRQTGKSNYSFGKSISVYLKVITSFSVIPLRIATIGGFIATIFGVILAFYYLYDYFIAKNFIEGWTTLVVLILFFGGLVLISLGVIGEYIGRIYLSQNKKPQYSISEVIFGKKKNE